MILAFNFYPDLASLTRLTPVSVVLSFSTLAIISSIRYLHIQSHRFAMDVDHLQVLSVGDENSYDLLEKK